MLWWLSKPGCNWRDLEPNKMVFSSLMETGQEFSHYCEMFHPRQWQRDWSLDAQGGMCEGNAKAQQSLEETYHCVLLRGRSPKAARLSRQQRNWLKFLKIGLVGKTHMQREVRGWEAATLFLFHFLSACHHGYLSICFPIRRSWLLGRHPTRNKRGENNETST